jgi:glycerol-3-phosphate dehydrogenase (NAD(P)+)
MDARVAIVGAGSWGTTLAKVAAETHPENEVALWARDPEVCADIRATRRNPRYLTDVELPANLVATTDLEEVCERALLLVLVVPSHGFRKVAYEMGGFVTGEHALVHGTKGIEQGTFKRMSEVLREETCVRKLGVLAGPNLALEVAQRHPAGTLVASGYDEVLERAQLALHNPRYFRVYGGKDVIGAEVGGAFKNIVALAAGVVDGLGLGDNTKALLLTRGINEMARLGHVMGGKVLTFGGMAGFGDLMATCASPLSRNHQVGERQARGPTLVEITSEMRMVAEGVKTSKAVHDFGRARGLDLPIVDAVYRLVHEGVPVAQIVEELMSRPSGDEFAELSLWPR